MCVLFSMKINHIFSAKFNCASLRWYQSFSRSSLYFYCKSFLLLLFSCELQNFVDFNVLVPRQWLLNTVSSISPIFTTYICSNYSFWRTQVLCIVHAHGFEQLIDWFTHSLIQFLQSSVGHCTPNPDFLSWIWCNQYLMSWIPSSITKLFLGYFPDVTPQEMYGVLLNINFSLNLRQE